MKHLALPDNTPHRLAFYLAMEEFAARELPPDDYFFAWRVLPTVICGRNQDIPVEVNLDYCRRTGIDVVRRRSGGGCVYADMNNWMFSYITPSDEVASTFSRYTAMIASMLESLGFNAMATGRNDLMINNRKVAGNAFYHLPGRSIVHGTMLCDIDFERMGLAITPSRAKLESKAVKSVQAHITSLKAEGLALTVERFGEYAVKYLTGDNSMVLTAQQVKRIEELEQRYYEPAYFEGRTKSSETSAAPSVKRSLRIEGAGEFFTELWLTPSGRISTLNITGDFFVIGDMEDLLGPLRGACYNRKEISEKLRSANPGAVINGLTADGLVSVLIE